MCPLSYELCSKDEEFQFYHGTQFLVAPLPKPKRNKNQKRSPPKGPNAEPGAAEVACSSTATSVALGAIIDVSSYVKII